MHSEWRLHALRRQRDRRQASRRQRVFSAEAAKNVVDVVVKFLKEITMKIRKLCLLKTNSKLIIF